MQTNDTSKAVPMFGYNAKGGAVVQYQGVAMLDGDSQIVVKLGQAGTTDGGAYAAVGTFIQSHGVYIQQAATSILSEAARQGNPAPKALQGKAIRSALVRFLKQNGAGDGEKLGIAAAQACTRFGAFLNAGGDAGALSEDNYLIPEKVLRYRTQELLGKAPKPLDVEKVRKAFSIALAKMILVGCLNEAREMSQSAKEV